MKQLLTTIITIFTLMCFDLQAEAQQLAFPGAEGYGKNTTGGRGGEVCYVTRLDDCSDSKLVEGTLRWALRHDNGGKPRIILFKVSGTIYLTSKLRFQYPDVSILGQSAPGGGICLAGYNMYISKDNVIVRYIRFRAGDIPNSSMTGLDMENCKNVILDHCSMTWSMEECLTAYDTKYTTVQWCIIGEGLYSSKNAKGSRAYATQWGGEHSSMLHTLITNSHSRSPRFNGARDAGSGHDTYVDSEFANNVVFNWSSTGAIYGGEMKQGVEGYNRVYMINNYYRPGPSSKAGNAGTYFASPSSPYGQWYLNGNKFEESGPFAPWTGPKAAAANADNSTAVNGLPSAYLYKELPSPLSETEYLSADEAFKQVTAKAGASLPRYDEVDQRLLDEAAGKVAPKFYASCGNKHLGIIDSPDDIILANPDVYYANGTLYNNYPSLALKDGDKYAIDTDGDGMPDAYEDAKGLNKNDAADGAADSGDGYTNLEKYLNGIADGTINKADYETSETPDIKGTVTVLAASVDGKAYTGYIVGGRYYAAGSKCVVAEGDVPQPVVTVAFDYEGVDSQTILAGQQITLPVIEKSGYDFKGWSDGNATYNATMKAEANITLTAVFEKRAGISGSGKANATWQMRGELEEKAKQNVYDANGKLVPATNVFDVASAAVGSALDISKKDKNNISYLGLQPAQQISKRDENNMVEFCLTPTNGLNFKPTSITMRAMRFGTDGGKIDITTQVGDGEEVTRLEGLNPNRDNNADGPSLISIDMTDTELSSKTLYVRVYLYSLGNTKQVGINDIVVSGEWEGTAQEAIKYKFMVSAQPAEGGTISQSPSGTEFVEDTQIKLTAKPKSDHVFINWTDNKGNEVTKNQTFTHKLTSDASFVANFRAISSYTDVFKEGSPYNAECRDAQELLIALKAAALYTGTDSYRIFLHDGTYDLGNTCLTSVPKNVSLIGESQNGTIIANTPEEEGIGVTATLFINSAQGGGATNIYMQDLTLLNRFDYGNPTGAFAGRAVCLQDKGTRNAYKNVTLLSNQDTYYANKGDQKVYWETSKITGTVDFLCGDASVFLNECEIYVNARNSGNVICAPNTQVGSTNWGFVFYNCTVDGDKATQDGKFSLGRPWNDSPHCSYINSTFKIMPQAAGWTAMGDGKVCRFHEFGSKDAQGNLLDLSSRNLSACKPADGSDPCVVDETFAAKYTVDAVCGTNWNPRAMTAQLSATEVTADGGSIKWNAVDGAYCYAIVKNGHVVDFTTETTYAADITTASYAIRVANQRGGLGPKSNVVGTDGIKDVISDTPSTQGKTMFSISGQRLTSPQRGQVYIQGGIKRIAK